MVAEAVDEDKLRLGHAIRLSGEAAVQQSPSNMEGVSPLVCQDVPAKILYTGSCHPRQMCPPSRRPWLLKLVGTNAIDPKVVEVVMWVGRVPTGVFGTLCFLVVCT